MSSVRHRGRRRETSGRRVGRRFPASIASLGPFPSPGRVFKGVRHGAARSPMPAKATCSVCGGKSRGSAHLCDPVKVEREQRRVAALAKLQSK